MGREARLRLAAGSTRVSLCRSFCTVVECRFYAGILLEGQIRPDARKARYTKTAGLVWWVGWNHLPFAAPEVWLLATVYTECMRSTLCVGRVGTFMNILVRCRRRHNTLVSYSAPCTRNIETHEATNSWPSTRERIAVLCEHVCMYVAGEGTVEQNVYKLGDWTKREGEGERERGERDRERKRERERRGRERVGETEIIRQGVRFAHRQRRKQFFAFNAPAKYWMTDPGEAEPKSLHVTSPRWREDDNTEREKTSVLQSARPAVGGTLPTKKKRMHAIHENQVKRRQRGYNTSLTSSTDINRGGYRCSTT